MIDSGNFTYDVDLKGMTQTNVSHPNRKCRRIRRLDLNASPPVDVDIDKFHASNPSSSFTVAKDEEHDEWCDVVLNLCDITGDSNNNKYYRLQLLEEVSTTL